MGTGFIPVGWDNYRVAPPIGTVVVTNAAMFQTEMDKVLPGGVNEGDSVDIEFTTGTFDEIAILGGYQVADGGTGIRLYGQQDGSSRIRFTGNGTSDAAGACLRIGSEPNQSQVTDGVEVYNLEFDGNSSGNGNNAIWGVVFGASFDNDTRMGNVHNYRIQGCRLHRMQISALKMDGDGGSSFGVAYGNTVHNTNQRYLNNGLSLGSGEGIYLGDGNTNRAYDNMIVERNHVYDVNQGEAIEFKANGTNCICRWNYVHDNLVHTGGAIKNIAVGTEIYGNRVHNIFTNGDSATGSGNAFFIMRTTDLHNTIAWDCDAAVAVPNAPSGQSTTSRHNTFQATTIWRLNQDGSSFGSNPHPINSDNDITVGNLTQGSQAGSSFNGLAASLGDFEGPTTGTADDGNGPGSGWAPKATSTNIVDAAPNVGITTSVDETVRPNGAGFDYGAVELGSNISVAFEITSPVDGSIDQLTPITPSGTGEAGSNYEHAVINDTTGMVLTEFGEIGTTHDPGTDTWTADAPTVIPQDGSVIRVKSRRVDS